MKNKAIFVFWFIVMAVPIVGVIISLFSPNVFFTEQENIRVWLNQFGIFGPVVFVGIQILQVIIAPISHYTTSVLGGFLYGAYLGSGLNWIGRIIGHLIAYWIAYRFGRIIVERFVNRETLNKFSHIISGDSNTLWLRVLIIFLMIFLPFFPDDEISYILGLAAFPFKYFLPVTLLGHLGGSFALAYAGAGIDSKDPYFWFIMAVTLTFFVVMIYASWKLRRHSVEEGN